MICRLSDVFVCPTLRQDVLMDVMQLGDALYDPAVRFPDGVVCRAMVEAYGPAVELT